MSELKKGPRGLPAIARLREERSRRGSRWTMQAGLVASGAVVVSLVFHTVVSRQDLAADRRALLAKESAVKATLGAQWAPFHEGLEKYVASAANAYAGDQVDPEARRANFRTQPGIYLRTTVAEARAPGGVVRAAANSRKDALVACLLREPNERGARGDLDAGAFADQP